MAVAAADFYTYARATGTPLPKSKQEEAKLAPAVDKWKKSRLVNKFTESKEDYIERNNISAGQVAGLTAIGAAALAAFNPNARRNLLNFVDKIPPNTESVIRDQSGQLVRGRPKPGTAVSTDLGGIKQDLNKLREETAKRSWEDQKAKQTFVVEKVPQTTVVEKVDSNLATTPVRKEAEAKQALDAYRDKWIAEHSTSKQNIAAIQQGIKESGGLRKEVRPDLSNLTEDQQKYLDFKIEEQASYDPKLEAQLQSQTIEQKQQVSTPRDYIESTGAIEAKSNQVTAVDASKLDDVAVSQQVIENTNLNLQDELNKAPQVGIDPEVSEVASSTISAQSGAVPVEEVVGNQQIVYKTPTRIQEGEIIRIEGPQGQVRYAETKADPSWVGAKSDIPTNTPVPGPDLSQTELSRVLQRQRYEIASNLRKKGEPITPGRIESELQKFYGPKSYDYVRNELRKTNVRDYTKRKHALQLGATYDPKFFDDVNLDSVQIAGEDIPVIPSRRYTEAKTPYTGKAYLDDYSDSLKTPFYSEDTALSLDEAVGKKKNWLKDVQEDITNTMENLESQAKIIKEKQNLARSQGDIAAVNMLEGDLNKLRATYQKQQRRMAGSEKSIKESIADLSVPLTVGELPENAGKRVYYETDTTGGRGQKIGKQLPDVDLADEVVDDIDRLRTPMIDPESVELRSEYRIKDTELKGGGGRKMAESGSPRPDNPLDTLVPLQQRGGTLFDRDTNTWKLMADIPENNRGLSRQTTRPVIDAIEPDTGVTDTRGLELSPKIYEDQQGGVTDIYGRRLASDLKDSDTARPTQVVGKVKGPQTQKPTAAMRGKSGTRVVNISENVRHLSDPNWLASQGYNLNKVSPQQLVGEYLQGLQSKTGSPDLQEFLQTRGQSRPLAITNENVDLRGTPVKFKPEAQPSVTQTKVAQPLNYPAAQNQVTYVPPTESTIKSLSVTPSEIEKAERMHLLNYISAAHGQIKGGARAGGTKMRNNLTPYQTPSDAMLNQLVMKRRMERI